MIGRMGSATIAFDVSVTCHCRHHGDLRRSYRAETVPPPSDVIVVATRNTTPMQILFLKLMKTSFLACQSTSHTVVYTASY